ncbi:MAG: glycoside hydrolase family 43 protein [Thermoguttaceae bacterium]
MHNTFFTALIALTTSVIATPAENPIIWADVPDIAIVRVGDMYYMSSTTMHMSPGLPIMKSKNLVDWEIASYAYDTLADTDGLSLRNGKSEYGAGSWASSFRYHDGTFYVSTFARSTGKTHIYTTRDIDKGEWQHKSFSPSLHDHSLFFDDDGKVYMVHGVTNLRLTELNPDLSGVKPDGFDDVIVKNVGFVASPQKDWGEGSQLFKVDGKYYLCNITWPDMRTQVVHRADKITGPYEGRVMLHDSGIAQGGLIDTPDGKWFAYLFQDCGAVGRVPFLVPLVWKDGWPVLGDSGVENGKVPMKLNITKESRGLGNIVASDEFDHKKLPLAWQWNHNPDNRFWSLADRDGWLRLTTGRASKSLVDARNSLTQRTFGPQSAATISLDVSGMKDGDCAGLAALQKEYGFIGVVMEAGVKSLVMVRAVQDGEEEVARVPLTQDAVKLKIECDFRNRIDEARFFWSTDGETWTPIGSELKMVYTLPHFMGYRFAIFNFATKSTGGFVDVDYYRLTPEASF